MCLCFVCHVFNDVAWLFALFACSCSVCGYVCVNVVFNVCLHVLNWMVLSGVCVCWLLLRVCVCLGFTLFVCCS